MMSFSRGSSATAVVVAASLAIAASAHAGGFAGNACVGKKQAAAGKYAAAVGDAWATFPSDVTSRNEAIEKAATRLSDAWAKEEAKAVKKGAACNEATLSAVEMKNLIDGNIELVTNDNTFPQMTEYLKNATKLWGKYIKDMTKDPGKTKLTAALAEAATEDMPTASMTVKNEAEGTLDAIVHFTTTAPHFPSTFQTIQPTVCAAGVCNGSRNSCTTNDDCSTILYGKEEIEPVCIDGDPYIYFVKKGSENNVVMYYQGGGACWSGDSCFKIPPDGAPKSSICARTSDATDNPDLVTTGFADYDNPDNPFHNWSVVFVSYCTCDVHWGSNNAKYGGDLARHHGRDNAATVEKFAREHFVNPDRVFVTGSSAGSYGAIMNSYFLMKNVWPNADFSVMGDAGVGVITKQWLDNYIMNWGLDQNFPTDLGLASDDPRDLSLVDLIDGLAHKFPNARFGNYDSSYDGGGGSQSNFFQVMHYPTPPFENILLKWTHYWEATCDWNACMREFKAENASRATNYHYFTGAGSRHTIFGSDKVYTETKSHDALDNPVRFVDWIQAMVDDSPQWVNVDCKGGTGNCNLTNSCQGGSNAGQPCSAKCVGGIDDGNDCLNNDDCDSSSCVGNPLQSTCFGGDNDTLNCANGDDCPGGRCVGHNPDCPGTYGTCEFDPDTTNAPYANNDTVSCGPTTCPCSATAAKCFGGDNDGDPCDPTQSDGTVCPGDGSCQYVNCSAE